ncbi:retrotransposon protein, putative, ty1-copia subclass [Tanacetum coccineum]
MLIISAPYDPKKTQDHSNPGSKDYTSAPKGLSTVHGLQREWGVSRGGGVVGDLVGVYDMDGMGYSVEGVHQEGDAVKSRVGIGRIGRGSYDGSGVELRDVREWHSCDGRDSWIWGGDLHSSSRERQTRRECKGDVICVDWVGLVMSGVRVGWENRLSAARVGGVTCTARCREPRSHSFWGYALESAARILSMVLTKKVDRTLYKIWHGKAPKLSYLRVWGCEALVKRDTPNKLDSRSIKCIFIGYPKETMGYYFYNPLENKIFVARNAKFFENSLTLKEVSRSHGLLEASGSDVGLELIKEDDTQPYENTSERHDEVKPAEVEPHSVEVPIRRSGRISQAPDRYGFYVDAEEHEFGNLNEPPNYKAALSDPESDKWLDAMNTKMQSMKDNQVWCLVDLPPNGRTVGSKWLFKKKTDMDGNVHTFKARLVAKDYTQTYDVDYGETFSLVADIRAIRILLATAALYDYEIWKMDVKTAFLNGHLSEDQASRSWNKRFDVEIKKVGFTQNPDESCVYLKASGSNVAFLLLYGDDILIMRINVTMLQDVKFKMENSKCGSVPMQEKLDYKKSQGANIPKVEYIDAAEASMEVVWMKKFINGLGDVMPSNKRPMEMLCDNAPAITIAMIP